MRKHYDFAKMKGRKNPYVRMLKQPVTIRLDRETVAYFKSLAVKTGLPYQNLINLYLRDCAAHQRELCRFCAVRQDGEVQQSIGRTHQDAVASRPHQNCIQWKAPVFGVSEVELDLFSGRQHNGGIQTRCRDENP